MADVPRSWRPVLLCAISSGARDSYAWEHRTHTDTARSSPPFFPFSSFLFISGCSIQEERNCMIFSPSPFLLKQVSQLSSCPRGLSIIVPFISAEGGWHLRRRAPDQPVSDKSHLFLGGKKLPTHEAAVLYAISVLIPAFNKASRRSLEIRALNLDPQLEASWDTALCDPLNNSKGDLVGTWHPERLGPLVYIPHWVPPFTSDPDKSFNLSFSKGEQHFPLRINTFELINFQPWSRRIQPGETRAPAGMLGAANCCTIVVFTDDTTNTGWLKAQKAPKKSLTPLLCSELPAVKQHQSLFPVTSWLHFSIRIS